MTRINKKAQEEMVGFVLIMLIVAIIFLVFLGLYLRGASQESTKDSKDVTAFLEAVTKTTTNCSSAGGIHYTAAALIPRALTGQSCSGGVSSEDALRDLLENTIEEMWHFNPDSPTKGYLLEILQETPSGERDIIPKIISNPTERTYASGTYKMPNGIVINLNIYT